MQQIPKIQKTHGQVTSALKKEAKKLGKNTNDVYNQFFREVFLHALMEHHKGWVLKGGSNIYCRIPGARQTKDLDLYRQDDPTSSSEAADSLIRSMQGHKVGLRVAGLLLDPILNGEMREADHTWDCESLLWK